MQMVEWAVVVLGSLRADSIGNVLAVMGAEQYHLLMHLKCLQMDLDLQLKYEQFN